MTSFKVPNKTIIILRKNCLKLLHTNGSRMTYWRLPTYFQRKAFLLQNLKAIKVSKLSITKLQKSSQYLCQFFLWCFTQFGVLINPIALKVVVPLLLDSNSWRDDTNPHFQFPIWQLTNKEIKRQAITKDRKNKMKAKPIEFQQNKFSRIIQQLKQLKDMFC